MKNTSPELHFNFQYANSKIEKRKNKNILKTVLCSTVFFGLFQVYDYLDFKSSVSEYTDTKATIKQEVVKNIKSYKAALRNNDVEAAIKSIESMKLLTKYDIENNHFIINRETTPDLFVAATYLNVLTSDFLIMNKEGKTIEIRPYPEKLIEYVRKDKAFLNKIENFNMVQYKCVWYSIACNFAKDNLNDNLTKQLEEDKMVLFHNKQEILYASSHREEYAVHIQKLNKWYNNMQTVSFPTTPFYLYQNPTSK